jgi:hypothetical protein
MNLNEQIEIFKGMGDSSRVEVYTGFDGWYKAIQKRTDVLQSPIKQIINAQMVAKFHAKSSQSIRDIIGQRVAKGLAIKNLIMFEDKELEVEKSNPATLKETRYMPEGFYFGGIIAVFGDYVTITSLNEDDCVGVIIHDTFIAKSFDAMFEGLWKMGTSA